MTLEILIDAVPQGRPRFVHGHAIDPPRSRQFKQEFQLKLKTLFRADVLTAPLKVSISIYRKLKRRDTRRFGDIDNLIKGIMDAMTGVVWKDDCQIVELHAYKFLDATPRVIVQIEEV